jgi:nitrous oxidase accessory protein NosD
MVSPIRITNANTTVSIGASTTVGSIGVDSNFSTYGVYIGVSATNSVLKNSGTVLGQYGVEAFGNGITISNNSGGVILSATYNPAN